MSDAGERGFGSGRELKVLAAFGAVGLALGFLPVEAPRFAAALHEALALTRWYVREHVLLCLVPALFIAGGIGTFVHQAAVLRYLGPAAPPVLAYAVASVSGTLLAACSCTVLPLFGGIWLRGAGLGPATAFLYSGPAINVLAVVMTARILGWELGVARAIGAVTFSLGVGVAMQYVFRREEQARVAAVAAMPDGEGARPLWQNGLFFGALVGVLVFANWSEPVEAAGLWAGVFAWKWFLVGACAAGLAGMLGLWFGFEWRELAVTGLAVVGLSLALPQAPWVAFLGGGVGLAVLCARSPGAGHEWLDATWSLAKQILPLLLGGVFVSGLLLGRPGHEALIPSAWVSGSVGGNSLAANAVASVVGAFMYFATLTEVPILQGLLGAGMGQGPALALLLAGPALSLPSMLVLRSLMGARKVAVYVGLVVLMATLGGLVYGAWFGPSLQRNLL